MGINCTACFVYTLISTVCKTSMLQLFFFLFKVPWLLLIVDLCHPQFHMLKLWTLMPKNAFTITSASDILGKLPRGPHWKGLDLSPVWLRISWKGDIITQRTIGRMSYEEQRYTFYSQPTLQFQESHVANSFFLALREHKPCQQLNFRPLASAVVNTMCLLLAGWLGFFVIKVSQSHGKELIHGKIAKVYTCGNTHIRRKNFSLGNCVSVLVMHEHLRTCCL